MATFKSIKQSGNIYVCDECEKDIPASDVITCEPSENINILTPMMRFVFIDKNGMVIGGASQPSKKLGDKVLVCPHCKSPHLFGFCLKKEA